MTKYFIRLHSQSDIDEKKIGRHRFMKKKLGQSIAQIFNTSDNSIQIGFVKNSNQSISIHLQHAVFEKDLEKVQKQILSTNQTMMTRGYQMRITEDMYIEQMFSWKKQKILSALLTHFELNMNDDERERNIYSVSYHKEDVLFDDASDETEENKKDPAVGFGNFFVKQMTKQNLESNKSMVDGEECIDIIYENGTDIINVDDRKCDNYLEVEMTQRTEDDDNNNNKDNAHSLQSLQQQIHAQQQQMITQQKQFDLILSLLSSNKNKTDTRKVDESPIEKNEKSID